MKYINIDNIRQFAYVNKHLVKKEDCKGIIMDFVGLYTQNYHLDDLDESVRFARQGYLHVIPYYDPWAWMNKRTVKFCQLIYDVLDEAFDLSDKPLVVCGASMGGLGAMIFSIESRVTPVACITNCPVCDLNFHYVEHDDMPRTIYSACFEEGVDLQKSIAWSSPMARVTELPKIKYTLMQCADDDDVHPYAHSEKIIPKVLELGHNIEYIVVPSGGHCGLNEHYLEMYFSKIEEGFAK